MLFSKHFHLFVRCFAVLIAVAAVNNALPAYAAMVFCNRTQGPIEAALGYRDLTENQKMDFVSEGWWRIEPGQCSRVFGRPLTQRFYYYYATSLVRSGDKTPYTWSGKYVFCTDTKAFKVQGDVDCSGRGYLAKGFTEIDIGVNTRDYTLDFRDGG